MPLLLTLLGCLPPGGPLDTGLAPDDPTYARDIEPMMARRCVRCHDSSGSIYGGVAVDSYDALWAARVKNTCVSINDALVIRYRDHLLPEAGFGSEIACEPWDIYSMAPGAMERMDLVEQATLARWTALGGPE